MLFDLQVHERGEWIVLSVVGELDLAAAPRTRQAVIDALGPTVLTDTDTGPDTGRSRPGPSVVLDLGAVDYIDSSGLGIVLGALKRVRLAGGRLRVVVREPQVRRVFDLVDLDRILALVDTVDEAMALTAAEVDRVDDHHRVVRDG